MDNSFQLNMNTNIHSDNCINEYLNKNNEKMYAHQFSVLNDTNSNFLDNHGLNMQMSANNNNDSMKNSTLLRNSKMIKKTKKELDTRVFPGSPYMGRGSGVMEYTDVNSKLNFGIDTRTKKSNNITSSYSADTFIPLVPNLAENIQNPKHIIPEYWVRGGMSSRVVVNNIDYLKSCGFKK